MQGQKIHPVLYNAAVPKCPLKDQNVKPFRFSGSVLLMCQDAPSRAKKGPFVTILMCQDAP